MRTYVIYIREDSGAINDNSGCSDYSSRESVLLDTLSIVNKELTNIYCQRRAKNETSPSPHL